jgi:hypothetical protein
MVKIRAAIFCLGMLAIPAIPGAVSADDWHHRQPPRPLVDAVREATKNFRDWNYALTMNYLPGPCVSGGGGGAMGVHFVNEALVDDAPPDVNNPEALIYEPQPDGSYRLVGVEYITLAGPAVLEGHLLNLVGSPNRYGLPPFYELHVWAWRENPSGTFADFNPRVSCDGQPLPLP